MGAKTGYADVILRVLGLRPGQGSADRTRYLWCEPDAGVRLLLEALRDKELALAAAEIIRGWRDEDPKALWTRLKDEGPVVAPSVDPREVARYARILTANRLVNPNPETWTNTGRGGYKHGGAEFCTPIESLAEGFSKAVEVPATITDDARTVEPREVARWARIVSANELLSLDSVTWKNTGAGGSTFAGNPDHGFYRPIGRLADGFTDAPALPATITDDARTVEPPTLPAGTCCFIDPPYVGTTGYQHDLGRPEVVALARKWAEAGAFVAISEAEPIEDLVAEGWSTVEITGERKGQKRTFSKQQREWLTLSRAPRWRPSVQGSLFG